MSAIEQILITHCTYGSSALERREGDFAHRMLGYSARAGSVDPAQLRHYYRQVERYAYYYLPRDTPVEEKLRLTAATAPMRMVYMPGSGGVEMLALVSYRQTDTEGRPGSYFAHVLLRDQPRDGTDWSALDCLRLWDAAGWLREDSAALPFVLPKLNGLPEMGRGASAAIDENVFLSFLTTPAGGRFLDPSGVISPRWRQITPAQRQGAFLRALSALMGTSLQPRSSVLLAIEPGMAALTFFGVLRLLPAALRRQISFSTFEPNPERIVTTLAATWFHNPAIADIRPDAMRGRGTVVSTLERSLGEPQANMSAYASLALEKLLQGGVAGVDALLQTFQAAGASTLADLERLAESESTVRGLLVPGGMPLSEGWRQSPAAEVYLRRRLAQEVAASGDARRTLLALVGSPQHLLLCELFATQPAACDFLLASLAEDRIAEAIAVPGIADEAKIALLTRLIAANGRLPIGCETLLGAAGEAALLFHPLMAQTLSRLTPEQIDRLRGSLPPERLCGLAAGLTSAWGTNVAIGASLSATMRVLDVSGLLCLLDGLGPDFFKQYPQDEPVLGERLAEALASLPDEPAQFSRRLDLLAAAQHLLPTDDAQEAVAGWARARRMMLEIGALQKKKSGFFSGTSTAALEKACRTMAEALYRVWKDEAADAGFAVNRKEQRLAALGGCILGEPFLPRNIRRNQALWVRICHALEHGKWSSANLPKSPGAVAAGRRPPWAAVAIIFLSLGAIGFALFYLSPWWPASTADRRSGTEPAVVAQRPRTTKTPDEKAGGRPATENTGGASDRAHQPAGDTAQPKNDREAKIQEDDLKITPLEDMGKKDATLDPAGQDPSAVAPENPGDETATVVADSAEEPTVREPVAEEPLKSTAEREAEWIVAARRFAAAHRGCVVENGELDQGVYLLPGGAVETPEPPSQLCLGSGWLKLDGEVFKFGDDFQSRPPAPSQQVPRLAEKLGFASLEISVELRDNGVCLVGRGEKRRVDQTAIAKCKDEIDKIKLRQNRLIGKKNEWDKLMRRPDGEEKDTRAAELRDVLIDEAQIELPPRPEPPDNSQPRYSKDNDPDGQLYYSAERAYEKLKRQREQAIQAAPDTAWQKLKGMNDQIKAVEAQIVKVNAEVRIGNDAAVKAWKDCRPTIAAILYQSGSRKGSPSGGTADAGSPREDSAAEGNFAAIRGAFSVDVGQGNYRPEIPYVGKVRLSAVGMQPKWLREGAIVNVAIREQTDEGEVRESQVIEVMKLKEHPILDGTKRVEIRYEFLPKGRSAGGAEMAGAGATPWQVIEPVTSGTVWTVKFEAEKNAWDVMKK